MMYNQTGNWSSMMGTFLGGATTAVVAAVLIALIVIIIAIYVYTSLAWYTIAKRRGHKHPWLAWIPVANFAMMLQLGGFHWAWVFLVLVPILGWVPLAVLLIISAWRIFEKLRYPGWLALAPLLNLAGGGLGTITSLIIIGIVAWRKR